MLAASPGCPPDSGLSVSLSRTHVPEPTERLGDSTEDGEGDRPVMVEPPRRGQSIGRYVVLDRVGAGATGIVFAAYDPDLDRRVAIKLLRQRQIGDDARMMREAQAVAKVVHPNVVGVHDVGIWRDGVFVAMEFVEGESLAHWLQGGPRGFEPVMSAFVQAGRGLAAAHEVGIVHRDFKPDNVLVGRDGRVRVADFGLARAAEPRSVDDTVPTPLTHSGSLQLNLTAPGTLVGTPAYMAPEQHLRRTCTAASDQFSFCVALWEALFGERPFGGESLALLAVNVIEGNVRTPTEGGAVPRRTREVLMRGLSPDPSARHPSMHQLLARLEETLPRRHRRWWTVGLLALGIGAGFAAARMSSAPTTSECSAATSPVAAVWDGSQAAAIEQAFAKATQEDWAPVTARTITSQLGDHAERFTAQWTELCEAQRDAGGEAPPAVAQRLACMEDRQREFAAVVELMLAVDANTAANAVDVLTGLREIEYCTADEALRQRSAVPPTALMPEVAVVREGIERAAALRRGGNHQRSDALLDELRGRATDIGWPHIELEVEAAIMGGTGSGAELELSRLRTGFDRALATNDPGLASRFALALGWEHGYRRHEFSVGREWIATGRALRDAAGGDWLLGVTALNNLAVIESVEGNSDRAGTLFDEAIALATAHDRNGNRVAQLRENLASYEAARGNHASARVLLVELLARSREQLGNNHPRTHEILTNLGVVDLRMGNCASAQTYLDDAARIGDGRDVDAQTRAQVVAALASLAAASGRTDAELVHLREALRLSERDARRPAATLLRRAELVLALLADPSRHRAEILEGIAALDEPGLEPSYVSEPILARAARGAAAGTMGELAILRAEAAALGSAEAIERAVVHIQLLAFAVQAWAAHVDGDAARRSAAIDRLVAVDLTRTREPAAVTGTAVQVAKLWRSFAPQDERLAPWVERVRAEAGAHGGRDGCFARWVDRELGRSPQ